MKKRFVNVHIEKAGGTTLHNWLKYNYQSYMSLRPWATWTNENPITPREFRLLWKLNVLAVGLGGHRCLPHMLDEKNIFWFTFLRDPVKRYMSHYYHQKYVMKNYERIEDFLAEDKFNNFMCKKLSGKECAESAYNNLKNFDFVGFVEHFDESIYHLASKLPTKGFEVTFAYRKKNTTDRFSEDLSSHEKDIRERNKEDIKLYERVYKERISSLNVDRIEFNNRNMKPIKTSRLLVSQLRKVYHRYISEVIAYKLK